MIETENQIISKLIFHNIDSSQTEADESSITLEKWLEDEDSLHQEDVCGIDQREKVIATTQMPYKAICKLYMLAPNGLTYGGTGWLINENILITAGHCVFSKKSGGWKQSIIVIPAKAGLIEPYGRYKAVSLMTTEDWFNKNSTRFDMGAIKIEKAVSHTDFITPAFDDSAYGEICGYPVDRDNGIFQYRMSDNLEKKDGSFHYQADTYGGQSGSPLLKNRTTAIGIHNYGGCPNKSSDLFEEFIKGAKNWTNF